MEQYLAEAGNLAGLAEQIEDLALEHLANNDDIQILIGKLRASLQKQMQTLAMLKNATTALNNNAMQIVRSIG